MIVEVIRLIDTNKAKLAFLAPFLITVLSVTGIWIATGEFNIQEIRVAASGVLASIAAAIAAYFGSPGKAVVQTIPDTEVDPEDAGIDH